MYFSANSPILWNLSKKRNSPSLGLLTIFSKFHLRDIDKQLMDIKIAKRRINSVRISSIIRSHYFNEFQNIENSPNLVNL